jgi:hypothetical protein
MIWAFVAALLAVPVGTFLLRPRASRMFGGDFQGVKTEAFTGPILTMTVFLTAFVMAQATQTFQRATQSASAEATAVSSMFDSASMLPDGLGQDLQAASVCYARAVENLEWPAMRDGDTSVDVDQWEAKFNELVPEVLSGPGAIVGQVVGLNRAQTEARSTRLYEAAPHLPALTVALMVISIISVVLLLTSFAIADMRRGALLGLGLGMATLLGGTLFLTEQLEEPFTGIVRVKPTVIAGVAADNAAKYTLQYPGAELPCDEQGRFQA